MKIPFKTVLPQEIEARSFEIIAAELGNRVLDPMQAPIIQRAIHTSADFDYADNLVFSPHAVEKAHQALRQGAWIVTIPRPPSTEALNPNIHTHQRA